MFEVGEDVNSEHNILLREPIGFPLTFTNTMNETYSTELAYAGIYSNILISPLTGDTIVIKIKEYFSFVKNILLLLKKIYLIKSMIILAI